jgi:molybdate transport system ATP-binding protein
VFDDVALALPEFTLHAHFDVTTNALGLFGPTGAGKTTLLEIVAGVRDPDRGRIFLDDVEITSLRSRDRRIGYVPQDDTLFPHMSVEANVMYGEKRAEARVADEDVRHPIRYPSDLYDRSVAKLSGGERRRVALARALATNPRLLLLDEALTGLDDALKQQIVGALKLPMIFVSHDRGEIAALCEHVVAIDRGQCSAPASLPHTSFNR